MFSPKTTFWDAFSSQQAQLNCQTSIVGEAGNIVYNIYNNFKTQPLTFEINDTEDNESVDVNAIALLFIKTLNKYLETIANEHNADRNQWMDVIKQLEHELSGEYLIGNIINYSNVDVQNCEATLKNLKAYIILLRAKDKENKTEGIAYVLTILQQIEMLMQQIGQILKPEEVNINTEETKVSVHDNPQKPINAEKCDYAMEQPKLNPLLGGFMEMLAKFRECLNETETGETIYLLEDTKASWAKQMKEIKQRVHELRTVGLLSNDIVNEFGDIDMLYELQLKELNRKINLFIEPYRMIKTEVMIDQFRRQLAKFRNLLNESEIGEPVCFIETKKATWDKHMDEIKQREHQLTTVYLLGNEIGEEFEQIEMLYASKIKELKRKMQVVKESRQITKNKIIIDYFRRKAATFKNLLNESEIGDTIGAIETTKISWEKEMNEIKEREYQLTTVYLIGDDIEEVFEEIEVLYELKLKDLNIKISEIEKVEKKEANSNLQQVLEQTETQMHKITQIEETLSGLYHQFANL